ncbi:MAG TPA: SDR family oxidoreductase [Arachidicoccus sp.]|nr:SDR family oxidoreductase [Arachidicoccus sp.]
MKFSLKGKTAIVTGAGSGIGQATALSFAAAGAHVVVTDLNEQGAQQTVSAIETAGGSAAVLLVNVTDQDAVKTAFARVGRVDILVNSAGVSHIGKLDNTPEADFDRVYQVNVKGVYNCMSGVIELMKSAGKGVILNLASIASSVGIPDRFAYSMSKGAVLAMTLSVARDYVDAGIRCNCISPARVHTPFVDGFLAKNYPGKEKEMFENLSATQPIGRMAKPAEIADLILYLCSEEAGFITGCDYPIDGGFIKLNN